MSTPFSHPTPDLKARLKAGEAIGCHWLYLGAPILAEIAAEEAPQTIVIDMQHGAFTREGLHLAVGLVGGRAPVLARLADASYFSVGMALDSGCHGVIAPMVNTPQQAAAVVAAAHYPPKGGRSSGGPRVNAPGYREAMAEHMVVAVMIETAEAVEACEAIAATRDLDMIFIGPGDLALALGHGAGTEVFEKAVKRVLAAGRANGVAVGIYTGSVEQAVTRAAEGFQFMVVANDGALARSGARSAWSAFAKRGG